MVVVRTLIATGLFDYLGAIALRLVRGDGRRLMIAIVVITAPICAFLPNATVVILLGPLILTLCQRMEVDFVQPLMVLVFVANSSGLLTLVGDPATFIVGNSIGLSFTEYLHLLSPGGMLAIVAVVAMLPLLFRSTWRTRVPEAGKFALPRIERPLVMLACLAVLGVMIALFMFGEDLPNPMAPPAVAIVGSTLLLLIAYVTRLDSISDILRDVDWESLVFFLCIFVLVGALDKTGVIGALGSGMRASLSSNVTVASLVLLFGIGALSSVFPNIALVVAMMPVVKQYAVGAGLATPAALAAGYRSYAGIGAAPVRSDVFWRDARRKCDLARSSVEHYRARHLLPGRAVNQLRDVPALRGADHFRTAAGFCPVRWDPVVAALRFVTRWILN